MLALTTASAGKPLQRAAPQAFACYASSMPLADSNGPRWIRKQKAVQEKALSGAGPIRRFLRALLRFSRRGRGPTTS